MKAFLLHKDHDVDLQQPLPSTHQALIQDLELLTLFKAMAVGDKFLFQVAQHVVLSVLSDPAAIRYRQAILSDCLRNASLIRNIYDLTVKTIESESKDFWLLITDYPGSILHRSVNVLQMLINNLEALRNIAVAYADQFESEGFTAFFSMLVSELSDDYITAVRNHLRELQFRDGVLISAELAKGNKGTNYTLCKPNKKHSWTEQHFFKKPLSYTFSIPDSDTSGARALSEIKETGINHVANTLAQSNDHILSFFSMLRTELAFYVGCLNLHEQLTRIGAPVCFPTPLPVIERKHSFAGLYDVCLSLNINRKVVGNDVNADAKDLVMITGANQGGKSTFLRSIGLAQLMMQCGMFVPATSFHANVCDNLFTHFRREEDVTMSSGKLDEELSRMSNIVDRVTSGSIILFNESFAATNEREGSEIARQIISALLERGIKVFFVTHLYELAHGFHNKNMENAIFLRAERQEDGTRTFKLVEAEPLQTSYGKDLYFDVFGEDDKQKVLNQAIHRAG